MGGARHMICLLSVLGATAPARAAESPLEAAKRHGLRIPAAHRQLLLVVVPRWSASSGTLRRLERDSAANPWRTVGDAIAIRIGAAGLGRGRGLPEAMVGALTGGPEKREGDRRSPAGVFALGAAFGTAPPDPASRWPRRAVDRRDRLVDDPRSPHYNTWQRLPASGRTAWRSAEDLSRYRLAIVVQHNVDPIKRGAGSAVFLHSAASLKHPSVGCTAMMESDLVELLRWLRPEARPVLVQLPSSS
jgi:L,D-peptidoglycan transpeptidase YkuD (ErfK/YbiS/YcfS/YnhG family)